MKMQVRMYEDSRWRLGEQMAVWVQVLDMRRTGDSEVFQLACAPTAPIGAATVLNLQRGLDSEPNLSLSVVLEVLAN